MPTRKLLRCSSACSKSPISTAFRLQEELGYDDLDYMLALDATALAGVARRARMKPGHAAKFAAWIKG